MFIKVLRPIAALVVVLGLSGCWHVPISAMWRLRAVDALNLDPAALRLAARVPLWLEPMPNSVKVKLTIQGNGEAERVRELTLERRDEPAELKQLSTEGLPGTHLLIFRASANDVAALRDLQAEVRAAKAADPNSKRKTSVALDSKACRRADPPRGPIIVDLYLSLGDENGFFKIYEDVDLRELQKPGQRFEDETPWCGKSAERAS